MNILMVFWFFFSSCSVDSTVWLCSFQFLSQLENSKKDNVAGTELEQEFMKKNEYLKEKTLPKTKTKLEKKKKNKNTKNEQQKDTFTQKMSG